MLSQTIHIESNQSVAFKTQVGETYGQNIRCKVFFKVSWAPTECSLKLLLASFQKTRSCPALVMSCPKFDVAHPRANCRPNNGDYLSLGSRRLQHECVLVESYLRSPPRFCKNTGPSNFTFRANKLIVQFRSNRRVHGEGAECTVACSDFVPTAETNPVTCSPEGTVLNWNMFDPNSKDEKVQIG